MLEVLLLCLVLELYLMSSQQLLNSRNPRIYMCGDDTQLFLLGEQPVARQVVFLLLLAHPKRIATTTTTQLRT